MKRLWLLVLVFVLAGCAEQKMLTREESLKIRNEQIAATTKIYQNTQKEDVLVAVDKLFRLADGSDFQITHSENSIAGSRRWLVYMVLAAVFGVDNWYVAADQIGNDVKVVVRVNTSNAPIAPMPVAGNVDTSYSMMTLPPVESTIQGNALYAIFFNRLDYLLGKSTEWWDCTTAEEKTRELNLVGDTGPLCMMINMKDNLPEGVPQKKRTVEPPIPYGNQN